jgi:hypothetical protein
VVGNDAAATTNTTIIGKSVGQSFVITGVNAGTVNSGLADALTFSNVGNLTGGALLGSVDSIVGNVGSSLSGAIIGGAGTTTLGGTITTAGAQTYTGIVTSATPVTLISTGLGSITAINAANDFVGAVNLSGGAVSIVDVNDLLVGTVTANPLVLTAANLVSNGGMVNATTANFTANGGSIGGKNAALLVDPLVNNQANAFHFGTMLTNITVGAMTTVNLASLGVIPTITYGVPLPLSQNVYWNGVSNASIAYVGAVGSTVGTTLAAISDTAKIGYGSANIGQQITNGFAGDIGAAAPGIDSIVAFGIRMAEGDDEENRRKQ